MGIKLERHTPTDENEFCIFLTGCSPKEFTPRGGQEVVYPVVEDDARRTDDIGSKFAVDCVSSPPISGVVPSPSLLGIRPRPAMARACTQFLLIAPARYARLTI